MIARADNPNLAILQISVQALGELSDSFVFVGRSASGLLITPIRANQIRATEDVDVVAEVATCKPPSTVDRASTSKTDQAARPQSSDRDRISVSRSWSTLYARAPPKLVKSGRLFTGRRPRGGWHSMPK